MTSERKTMIAAFCIVFVGIACGLIAYKLTIIAYTWLLPHISH